MRTRFTRTGSLRLSHRQFSDQVVIGRPGISRESVDLAESERGLVTAVLEADREVSGYAFMACPD